MPRIVRRNSPRRFAACFIVMFVMAAIGIMVFVGIALTVILVAGSSGSSSGGDSDSTPGVGTTAPATGGWSSGG